MASPKGRLKGRLHPDALKFSSSLPVDKKLFEEDIDGSIAHANMLATQKIISTKEARAITTALEEIRREIRSGALPFDAGKNAGERFIAEDIHMAIEHRLTQKIGLTGGKLHTARSRNDQVALDVRLYLRKQVKNIDRRLQTVQKAFLFQAEKNPDIVMPGTTHLQHAQPVLLAHHLLAYVSMFERDRERFADCLKRINRSPLGAGALAGTSFPIDRNETATRLGFDSVLENSIDAISDRDVHIEFISACAIAMMHLSRFAEELVLWSAPEWNIIELADDVTTGSSIMPQKKNPDMAELIRGKTGRVYGDLMTMLTVMKGLPLAYNRDMQEDKEPLFDASDTVNDCLHIAALMLKSAVFKKERFRQIVDSDAMLATDLADYLVRKGETFREAHGIVGAIARLCSERNIQLKDIPLKEYQKFSGLFRDDVYSLFDVRASLEAKISSGSTSPKEVRSAIQRWKKKLKRTLR